MKNAIKRTIAVLFAAGAFASCSLDEWNPSTVDLEMAYTRQDAWTSLIDYCYNAPYYFYGKIDGVGAMEMGTDLWYSEAYETAFTQYDGTLNTQQTKLTVFWDGLYAMINYCNAAIYYADIVADADPDYIQAKLGEAYFLRGWAYWHVVEQFGGVVLNTLPSSATGFEDSPVRSSEVEIYDLIISDLKKAVDYLPVSQSQEVGRASKKAALAMLAKAYLQRTRLNEPEAKEYARLALETAQELIDNAAAYGCGLWESGVDALDNEQSGYAKLWFGANNPGNKEFLFSLYNDPINNHVPEGSGRGRTRQFYLANLKQTDIMQWGLTDAGCAWYGRANERGFKPTKYLLTEIFEPVKDPADTRFDNSFFTEYYNSSWSDKEITEGMINTFNKNSNLKGHVIKNTCGTWYVGETHYKEYQDHTVILGANQVNKSKDINATGQCNMVDTDGDGWLDGLSLFTPNYPMTETEKSDLPFVVKDPADMFNANGTWSTDPLCKDFYPSLNKFSSPEWIYSNQYWLGDYPIIRLGDIYLVAAEAALRYNNDQTTALKYVQPLRNRAAVKSRESEMAVATADMTLDFILAERGRELAGEQWRWYDLKRMGKLTTAYLKQTNPDITAFDEAKHQVRPIPQSFLDAIANAAEFGNNGY